MGINNPILGSGLSAKSGTAFFQGLIIGLINLGFVVGIIIFVFMIILAGIGWISSGGDKGAAESARSRLTYAVIGLTVLFSVYIILNLVGNFFGFNILFLNIGAARIQ